MTDAFQGGFVTDWLYSEGHKNVAIMYENDDCYGNGLKNVVQSEIAKDGGKVARTCQF